MSASRPPPPVTGCMWISATASDGADGRRDGIANFGALYGVDLNRERSGSIALKITCRAQFDGGSATTPGLRAASMRVYTADADGRVKPADPKSIDEFICLAPCRRPSGPGLPPGCSEFCSESRADFVADCSLRHSFSDEPACESSRPNSAALPANTGACDPRTGRGEIPNRENSTPSARESPFSETRPPICLRSGGRKFAGKQRRIRTVLFGKPRFPAYQGIYREFARSAGEILVGKCAGKAHGTWLSCACARRGYPKITGNFESRIREFLAKYREFCGPIREWDS